MQGIELVAIFSLLSSLFSLFSAPSSLLSSALDSRNRIPAFLQGIMRPRGVLHCKNEAIRGGPGANKPCCQSIWGSLAAFFVISSLFSLLASLAAARPGKVQTLLQYSCSSVVHYFYKGLPASLCALPSSLLGPDPFLYHPALLGPNHLSSLFSFPSSLAVALFPDPTWRLPLRSVHQAIDCAPNCFDPLRLPPWPGGMREAIK